MAKDNLKQERLQILQMLKDGIITAEEAERLLDALSDDSVVVETLPTVTPKAKFRMIKIRIESKDNEKVRMQIPVEFAKVLKHQKFGTNKLGDLDIDVDSLIKMIDEGMLGEIVNIEGDDGIVKIYVE